MSQPTAKPEIVSYGYGAHNEALMSGQHIHGNSWKKARIIKIVPSDVMISAKVALSHENLIFPPNQGVFKMLVTGHEVGTAYNLAIESILAHPDLSQWEYILTVESDNIPPPDGVLKLLRRMEDHPEFAGIGGLYACKGPGGCFHCWGDINDPIPNYRPQMPRPGELMEVYGTSMGFNLWRISQFKDERIKRPWFQTKASIEGVGTQDLSYAAEARKYGYRFAVDAGCLVGHIDIEGKFGPAGMIW